MNILSLLQYRDKAEYISVEEKIYKGRCFSWWEAETETRG